MNTITRQTATEEQLEDIHNYIHQFMGCLGEGLEGSDECGIPVADSITMILGTGVKSGALGKFENLDITNAEITFDVWIRVNPGEPGLYYKVKTHINLEEKRAQVIEE